MRFLTGDAVCTYIIYEVTFLGQQCIVEGCLLGRECSSRVLGGLLHKPTISGATSGSRAEETHVTLPTAVGVQKKETWLGPPKQIIATREI